MKLQADVFIKSTLVYIFTRLLIRVSFYFHEDTYSSLRTYVKDGYNDFHFSNAAIPLEMLPIFLAGVCAIVLFGRKN